VYDSGAPEIINTTYVQVIVNRNPTCPQVSISQQPLEWEEITSVGSVLLTVQATDTEDVSLANSSESSCSY